MIPNTIDFNKKMTVEQMKKNIEENELKNFFNEKKHFPFGIVFDYDVEEVKKMIDEIRGTL